MRKNLHNMMRYQNGGKIEPFVTSDINEYNRRQQAFSDSTLIYETDKKLTENLIKAGYSHESEDANYTSKLFGKGWDRYADKKGLIRINRVKGRTDLYSTPDLYAGVIDDRFGEQYMSKKIIPKGGRTFGKWIWKDGDWYPSWDLRRTHDYSNVKPTQEVIYKPELKSELKATGTLKTNKKSDPVVVKNQVSVMEKIPSISPYIKTNESNKNILNPIHVAPTTKHKFSQNEILQSYTSGDPKRWGYYKGPGGIDKELTKEEFEEYQRHGHRVGEINTIAGMKKGGKANLLSLM